MALPQSLADGYAMESIGRGISAPNRKFDFMVTAYMSDANGVLQAVLPCRCLRGSGEDNCRLKQHSGRVRKSILDHPLVILHCATHGGYLTLYPPGFTPYARLPLVHCDTLLVPLEPENATQDPWTGTRLELPEPVLRRSHDLDTESQGVARKSGRRSGSLESNESSPSQAASSVAFERTIAPLVGADGGFGKDSDED